MSQKNNRRFIPKIFQRSNNMGSSGSKPLNYPGNRSGGSSSHNGASNDGTSRRRAPPPAGGGGGHHGGGSGGGVPRPTSASRNRSASSQTEQVHRGAPPPQHRGAAPSPPRGGPSTTVHHGPGAFSVDPSNGPTSVFRVSVPEGVRQGQEFQVYAGSRLVRVRCPPGIRPGQSLQITVPSEPTVTMSAGIPQMMSHSSNDAPIDMPPALQDQMNGVTRTSDGSYTIRIPPDVRVGDQFPVTLGGQQLMVTCPPNASPGMSVRINPPAPPPGSGTNLDRPPSGGLPPEQKKPRPQQATTQMFEVVVPAGVRAGQPFALMAGGQRVLVTCPPNAGAGQKIRFQLPINLTQHTPHDSIQSVRLKYDKDGWTRTIRVQDMKFQWVRMDDKGDVANDDRFDIKKSAYVRKLDFTQGVDHRMRGGNLSLVPATESTVDSQIRGPDGREFVSYADIASAQIKGFEDKAKWFHETCRRLRVEWEEGHMRVNVRRDYLLNDSMMAIMSLSRKDLRKIWKFDFIGEEGIDAGGLAREWFELVTDEIFNPDNGLWQYSSVNQMCMEINPASELLEDHLVYFRFLGRVMGKALFDNQLVSGHMIRHMYKHLLGWPITFEDLELVDEEIYKSLRQMEEVDDVEMLCLDFTATEENLGTKKEVELVKGGKDIEVTNDNLPEYMECCLKYRLMGRVKAQLTELLLGFADVIPEPLMTVFDFQELELLMCGLPDIDVSDWRRHTEYTGAFERDRGQNEICYWFWEVVEEFDQERKARLLQFVTGTSGVPAQGFAALQGDGGNIRRFTIHGTSIGDNGVLLPRAHTCFNRLDLPTYTSKEQLHEKVKLALEMAATGFEIE